MVVILLFGRSVNLKNSRFMEKKGCYQNERWSLGLFTHHVNKGETDEAEYNFLPTLFTLSFGIFSDCNET